MEIHHIPNLRDPIMLLAFSGWNDAGAAATGAMSHLLSGWEDELHVLPTQLIADIDSEDFYDYQVNRPQVYTDENSTRKLIWPTTEIFGLSLPHLERDLVLVKGVEPSIKWKRFSQEILDLADDLEVSLVLTLGALLADIPHTRPIHVGVSAVEPAVARAFNVEVSTYEGATGILGVIHDACLRRGINSLSLWAPVPHYASSVPSPKATLALIVAIENLLAISIPQENLALDSHQWEKEVSELISADADISEYVRALEVSKDEADISGEMIAKEFERYLRRETGD